MEPTFTKTQRPERKNSVSEQNSNANQRKQRKTVSERRKRQNCEAQKAYRARQKSRLEFLERQLDSRQEPTSRPQASPTPRRPFYYNHNDLLSLNHVQNSHVRGTPPDVALGAPNTLKPPGDIIEPLQLPRAYESQVVPLDAWDSNLESLERTTLSNGQTFPMPLDEANFDTSSHIDNDFFLSSGIPDWLPTMSPTFTEIEPPPFPTVTSQLSEIIEDTVSGTSSSDLTPIDASVSRRSSTQLDQPRLFAISLPGMPTITVRPWKLKHYLLGLHPSTRRRLLDQAASKDFKFIETITTGLKESCPGALASSHQPTTINTAVVCPMKANLPTVDFDLAQYLTSEILSTTIATTNLPIQTLRIERLSYFTAIFANASILGFDFAIYLDENAVSPLYTSPPSPNSESLSSHQVQQQQHAKLPRDLRPLPIQLQKPHHPYLDVLPFPTLRERAILAATTTPPLLDEDDFCVDLMIREGLICWGSSGNTAGGKGSAGGSGGVGMECGLPWDSRSWEPKLWFLRKWGWLMGSLEDELWGGRRWWCMMRGERFTT